MFRIHYGKVHWTGSTGGEILMNRIFKPVLTLADKSSVQSTIARPHLCFSWEKPVLQEAQFRYYKPCYCGGP